MESCPDQKQLRRYIDRSCSEQERRSLDAHFVACSECRHRLEVASTECSDGQYLAGGRGDVPAADPGSSLAGPGAAPTLSMPAPSDHQSVDHATELHDPIVFEGYQILGELPQGGQAIVYKAIHKATKSKVALKVLLPSLTASAKARYYFRQEVELAASLEHPNIVSIHDTGISHGQHYFAMDYIHGKPLDQYVQAKALSIRDKLILFTKICDAVAHAHQRGVIHRDLKPSNILVDDRGEPHLLDFGLAKTAMGSGITAGSAVMPTMTGQIKGTIAYMAPEQAAGRSDLVDVRSDVYSLGVVLYRMCLGRLPYDVLQEDTIRALQTIQNAEPVRPRQVIHRFDSDVEAILLKCLAKDPDQRYQSAAGLKQEVQRWLDGLPIVAKSISSIYLLRKIVARHQYTAAVVGLVLFIVVSFSIVSFQLHRRSERRQRELQAALEKLTVQATAEYRGDRGLAFLGLLERWREGNIRAAVTIARLIGDEESKEKRSAWFLLGPAPAVHEEEAFRRALGEEWQWFADFVIAEKQMQEGAEQRAMQAYERSYLGIPQEASRRKDLFETLLRAYVKTRILEHGPGLPHPQVSAAGRDGGDPKWNEGTIQASP